MALTPKQKGNAAFTAGDYPTAIGHYSQAIYDDPTDPTFPLNRAAAYLKLGKNQDAERDCDTVLRLTKGNVKALFRRAQARVALGKLDDAHADLNEAATLEPANQSVKQELAKVVQLIQTTKPTKPKIALGPAPKRRRVPITVVEADGRRYPAAQASSSALKTANANEANPVMNVVSSRSLSPTPTPPKEKENPTSFKDAKSARESKAAAARKIGGGIFRASGESVLFKQRDSSASAPAPPAPTPAPALQPKESTPTPTPTHIPEPEFTPAKPPLSLFEFTRAWERAGTAGERFALLCAIPPGALPTLFQASLEASLFVEIVDVLHDVLASSSSTSGSDDQRKDKAAAYLHAFARVPRFGTVLRFLSTGEREKVRGVWGALGVTSATQDGLGGGRPTQLGEVWGPVWR